MATLDWALNFLRALREKERETLSWGRLVIFKSELLC